MPFSKKPLKVELTEAEITDIVEALEGYALSFSLKRPFLDHRNELLDLREKLITYIPHVEL